MKDTDWVQVTDGPCPLWWRHRSGEDYHYWSHGVPDKSTTGWQVRDADVELSHWDRNPLKPEFRINKNGQVRPVKQKIPVCLLQSQYGEQKINFINSADYSEERDQEIEEATGLEVGWKGFVRMNPQLRIGGTSGGDGDWAMQYGPRPAGLPKKYKFVTPKPVTPKPLTGAEKFEQIDSPDLADNDTLTVGMQVSTLEGGDKYKATRRVLQCIWDEYGEGQNVILSGGLFISSRQKLGPEHELRVKVKV